MRTWRHTPGSTGCTSLGILLCTWTCQTAAAVMIEPPAFEPATREPVYFLVGEFPDRPPQRNDAYVLPLTDPQDIAHARRLVAEGPSVGRPLAVANIAPGADGINGDWKSPGTRLWSWHVTEFLGFGDITAEILDSSPGFVEEGMRRDPRGSSIGFWSYTVVRELPRMPPLPGDTNLDGSVNGTDFALLASNFGRRSDPDWGRGDFNHDGAVDGTDFALLAGNFGRGAPGATDAGGGGRLSGAAAVVPEPALCLLGLPLVLLVRARARRTESDR